MTEVSFQPAAAHVMAAGYKTGTVDTGEGVANSMDWNSNVGATQHFARTGALASSRGQSRAGGMVPGYGITRSSTAPNGILMRSMPASSSRSNNPTLAPIDRSWARFPQYWIQNKEAAFSMTASQHAKPSTAPVRPVRVQKPLRASKSLATIPAPARAPALHGEPIAVTLACNALHDPKKLSYKPRTFEQLGEPEHLQGHSTHQQRWNLFNFPTQGTHFKIPYHAAAARSMSDTHEAVANTNAFRKWKRRPQDFQ